MKNFILLLPILSITAPMALASTVDTYTFPLVEGETEELFLFNTIQTKTAYRLDITSNLCYRSEFYEYSNICGLYPEIFCRNTLNRFRACNFVSTYGCQQIPHYREVPYSCDAIVATPYEIFDHKVISNFNVSIINKTNSPIFSNNCLIKFNMEGDNLNSNAVCDNYLIFVNQRITTDINPAGIILHHYKIDLKLLDTLTTLSPLKGGIREMHIDGHNLIFGTGDFSQNSNFTLHLFVERRYLLKGDQILIDRDITPNEYTFTRSDDSSGIVKINLDKFFSGFNNQKKYVMKVDLSLNLDDENLINTRIPEFKTDSSIIIND